MEWFYKFGRRMAQWLDIADWFHSDVGYAAFGMSVLLFIFFVFCGWLAIRKARKTRAALAKFARQTGWSFKPEDKTLMSNDFFTLPLFQRGSWRGARNVFKGQFEGAEFTLFELWYKNKDMPSNHYMVVAFFTNDRYLPEFQLSHEALTHEDRKKTGNKIIEYNSDPEFSKRYTLSAADEESVRKLFTENIRSFLRRRPRKQIGALAGKGRWLVFYQSTRGYMGRAAQDYIQDIQAVSKFAFQSYKAFMQ